MSDHDLDVLYRRASGQDGTRPSGRVRRSILEHARRLAADHSVRTPPASWRARLLGAWQRLSAPPLRWQIIAPLAAAALSVMVLWPLLRSTNSRPTRLYSDSGPLVTRSVESATRQATPAQLPQTGRARLAPPSSAASNGAAASPPESAAKLQAAPEPFPATAPAPFATAPAAAAAAAAAVAPAAGALSNADVSTARRVQSPAARLQTQSAPLALESQSAADALRGAAASGDVERLETLLQINAASIDARDARGRTALMLAALRGQSAAVALLLAHGADPNIADAAGRTPLAVALQRHDDDISAALERAGAH